MFGRTVTILTIRGIPLRIDASWIFIAVLITWSLAGSFFPASYPELTRGAYWFMGVAAAMGLFISIILHEFAHAVVAQRHGVPINSITLFIFGGVAEMRDEPRSPRAEFLVAIAGPIASLLIAGACYVLAILLRELGVALPAWGVAAYLATINLILVAFNLIPAFPLDGGRVLRSALWKWQGSLKRATRIASQVGSGFGVALIIIGTVSILVGGFIGGLWYVLIGLFLRSAAQMSYSRVLMRRVLEGEPVRRFMKVDPTTVAPELSIAEFVEDYVYRLHHKLFPVTANGRLLGCVSTSTIREVPREDWARTPIQAVATPCSDGAVIGPDDDAMHALSEMHRTGASRLMVVEAGERLVGILTIKDLLDFISLKIELEEDESKAVSRSTYAPA